MTDTVVARTGWADPLYVPCERLSDAGQRFAGVDAEVAVLDTAPDSVEAQWRPDRVYTLRVPDTGGAADFARVLPEFRAYARALAGRAATAMLTLPSRDVDRCRVAREHGFTHHSTLAVCPLPHVGVVPLPLPPGVTVRAAAPGDEAGVTELWWAQAEYEARVGTLRCSPGIRDAIARRVPEVLAGPAQVLVAERGGALVATLIANAPADSVWAGARLRLAPVSYLALASTAPDLRGSGVGGALVRELHRRLAAADVAASLLHYGAHNPLSVPFWSQHGYRPLLSTFTCPL